MAKLNTRAATPDDFEFCWDVYSSDVKADVTPLLKNGWDPDTEKTRFQTIWAPDRSHLVLYDDKPVGWFDYQISGDTVHLKHGYLKPSDQRKQIGAILLDFICDEAKKQGKSVSLEVLKGSSAKSFFEEHGFSKSGSTEITVKMERHF